MTGSGVLRKVHWWRIVVDEIQFVRNDTSQIARAMHSLISTHIWMLSGTPFTKQIDEMQGVLSLLRLWPFALSKGADHDKGWTNWFWIQEIKEKWENKDEHVLGTLLALLRGVMMRHSRFQCYVESGCQDGEGSEVVPRPLKPLVPLPAVTVKYVGLSVSPHSSEGRWQEYVLLPNRLSLLGHNVTH